MDQRNAIRPARALHGSRCFWGADPKLPPKLILDNIMPCLLIMEKVSIIALIPLTCLDLFSTSGDTLYMEPLLGQESPWPKKGVEAFTTTTDGIPTSVQRLLHGWQLTRLSANILTLHFKKSIPPENKPLSFVLT